MTYHHDRFGTDHPDPRHIQLVEEAASSAEAPEPKRESSSGWEDPPCGRPADGDPA